MNAIDAAMMNSIVDGFFGQRVLVIGDLMLDVTVGGNSYRQSPEDENAPVIQQNYENVRVGGAANAAMCLRALGAEVTLCGITGADQDGKVLKNLCDTHTISTAGFLQDKTRVTTRKMRIEINHDQYARLDKETIEPVSAEAEMLMERAILGAKCDAIYISDYSKGMITEAVMDAIRDRIKLDPNITVLADPKSPWAHLYGGVHHLTPNSVEYGCMWDSSASAMVRELGLRSLLITLGVQGVEQYRDNRNFPKDHYKVLKLPAIDVAVQDVTGAGDATAAAYLLSILAGAELPACAYMATLVGGLSVDRLGNGIISSSDLRGYISDNANPS
jgi:rfaE bifunctional protein kinase chain/domain